MGIRRRVEVRETVLGLAELFLRLPERGSRVIHLALGLRHVGAGL